MRILIVQPHLLTRVSSGRFQTACCPCRRELRAKRLARPERPTLQHAKERLAAAGLAVSGCVTTTKVGKPSTGWGGLISCYTDPKAQEKVQGIFEFAASLFDEIMIDDFWFTDCACPKCEAARGAKTVTVGQRTYPVAGDTWEDYRSELMVRVLPLP